MDNQEKGVSLGTAVGLVIVVVATLVFLGMFLGDRFFWNQGDDRTIAEVKFSNAKTLYENAPESKQAKLAYALALQVQGQIEVAGKLFEELMADFPKDNDVLINVAIFKKETGHIDEAKEIFEKVLEKAPFFFVGNVQYGIMLRDNGEYDEAIEKFDNALKVNRSAADVLTEKAKVYIAKGDKQEAKNILQQVLKYLPEDEAALKLLDELQ